VAQPALSRQVRLLEVELRQNLLQRHGRGACPPRRARCCWSTRAASCTRWGAPATSWRGCAAA
jgi:DNA-binding transcriptional LysR family regulator